MARSEALWTDLVSCAECGAVNDARDEWCERCLADIDPGTSPVMFVRRWSKRDTTARTRPRPRPATVREPN